MRSIYLAFLACLLFGSGVAAAHAVDADTRYWQAPISDAPTLRAVQRALRDAGYDPGPLDGTLNAKTAAAVKQAQKDLGLEPTGRVDRRTAAALGIIVQQPHARPGLEIHMNPRGG